MNIEQVLAALTPEIVARFKTAIEIGKWPNGQTVSPEQREICMQAVLAWEHIHLPEQQRTGYINRPSKSQDDSCDSHDHSAQQDNDQHEERPLRLI